MYNKINKINKYNNNMTIIYNHLFIDSVLKGYI